jgi:hypothetical protein
MTDPDPVADLAAQVEALRGQLAQLAARMKAEGPGAGMLALVKAKELGARLDEAIEKRRLEPPPAPWWCVDEAEGRAMLAQLREWVDGFLRPHYPDYMTRLPACWARHMTAVWELSTLRAEHERIYGDKDNRDLQGALDWHARFLPGVLDRLAAAIKCDEAGCRIPRRPPA